LTTRQDAPARLEGDAAGRPTRFASEVAVDDEFLTRVAEVCDEVSTADEDRVAAGRDWWPLSVVWAVAGTAPALPAAVARPAGAQQVAAVLRQCHDARVPVTVVAGASGVGGGSVPLFGGIALDLTRIEGIVSVDQASLLVDVRAGTFGDWFEATLRADHHLTVGHWPQSVALSTVGGWLACRGAGQFSTRYGKIEDMVVGLEVALADGRLIRTGGTAPRAAAGPDLTQLFVGSEGTLGVITEARLRAHPEPPAESRAAFAFPDFETGLDVCRRILRRGATPAVLRLYDPVESARHFSVDDVAVLIVIDEGDAVLVDAAMTVVDQECRDAPRLDPALAGAWLEHRNELPPLEDLVRGGIVADTIEVAGSWRALPEIYRRALEGISSIEGTIVTSAHQSHSYVDGGCLYFTFAGRPPAIGGAGDGDGRGARGPNGGPGGPNGGPFAAAEAYYRAAFDAVMAATIGCGGAVSHHHGIGLNRGRYMGAYLGEAFGVLASVKRALDPHGILNPGKLGLPSPFGAGREGEEG
jgi:alkyldihydroxyacetonephosphate synthase